MTTLPRARSSVVARRRWRAHLALIVTFAASLVVAGAHSLAMHAVLGLLFAAAIGVHLR